MNVNRVLCVKTHLPWKGRLEVNIAGNYSQVWVGELWGVGTGTHPGVLRNPTPDIMDGASESGLQGAPRSLESEDSWSKPAKAEGRFGSHTPKARVILHENHSVLSMICENF